MQTHKKIVYFKKLALENWAQFQNNSIIFPEIEFDKNNINIFYLKMEFKFLEINCFSTPTKLMTLI